MINDSCDPLDIAHDICPTREQIFERICSDLPSGRAWQTHNTDVPREKSVLQKFWWAVAGFMEYVNDEMCRVIDEYFCDTVNDLKQVAMVEYGIPDDCGLYRDLCTKIRAMPQDHCSYYIQVAAQLGYKIDCSVPREIECYPCTHTSMGSFALGHASFCAQTGAALRIDYCPPVPSPELIPNNNFDEGSRIVNGFDAPSDWFFHASFLLHSTQVNNNSFQFTVEGGAGGIATQNLLETNTRYTFKMKIRRVSGGKNSVLSLLVLNEGEAWIDLIPKDDDGGWHNINFTTTTNRRNIVISQRGSSGLTTWEIDYISVKLEEAETIANCDGLMIMGHTSTGCAPACIQPQLPDDLACVLDVIVPAHMAIEVNN